MILKKWTSIEADVGHKSPLSLQPLIRSCQKFVRRMKSGDVWCFLCLPAVRARGFCFPKKALLLPLSKNLPPHSIPAIPLCTLSSQTLEVVVGIFFNIAKASCAMLMALSSCAIRKRARPTVSIKEAWR